MSKDGFECPQRPEQFIEYLVEQNQKMQELLGKQSNLQNSVVNDHDKQMDAVLEDISRLIKVIENYTHTAAAQKESLARIHARIDKVVDDNTRQETHIQEIYTWQASYNEEELGKKLNTLNDKLINLENISSNNKEKITKLEGRVEPMEKYQYENKKLNNLIYFVMSGLILGSLLVYFGLKA